MREEEIIILLEAAHSIDKSRVEHMATTLAILSVFASSHNISLDVRKLHKLFHQMPKLPEPAPVVQICLN